MSAHSPMNPEIYAQIFEALVDVVFVINVEPDGNFRFVKVNNSFLSVTGLKEDQVIGKYVQEVIPEPSLSLVLKNYNLAIKEKRAIEWEEVTDYPTGRKYGEVAAIPIFDKEGNCVSIVGTVHDVTPVKVVEQNLRNMLERISDGFVGFDTQMNYTYVNKLGAEYLGRTPHDLIGKNYFKEYPAAVGTTFAKAYVEALKTQKPIELREYYEDWKRWFENRIYPSPDGLTVFFSDITEQVHHDEQLRDARVDAEEALVARSRFLDIAAHELRNPVASIYLMIQVMQKQIEKGIPIETAKISELMAPAARLNRLVADLLDMSRLEKDILTLHKSTANLSRLVPVWIEEIQTIYPGRKVNYRSDKQEIFCLLDQIRIFQVFSNILENAFKYSSEDQAVTVSLEDMGSEVSLSIKDEGVGMTEEMMKNIFDPFSRGGVDIKVRHTGFGLGLPISRKIVELHDGVIKVQSAPGKGSEFSVQLPKGATT